MSLTHIEDFPLTISGHTVATLRVHFKLLDVNDALERPVTDIEVHQVFHVIGGEEIEVFPGDEGMRALQQAMERELS